MTRPMWGRSAFVQAVLVAGICLSVVLLTWLGFRVSREWQRSAALLAERRADEAASLFAMAVSRDMRAVQSDVLVARTWERFRADDSNEVTMLVASAFARYPYPEFFFAVDARDAGSKPLLFLRADRPPAWGPRSTAGARFPVRVEPAPTAIAQLSGLIGVDVASGKSWSAFDVDINGRAYQVIARIDYADRLNQRFAAAYGFAVDLVWVRQHYFQELTRQVQRISGEDTGLGLAIVDDAGGTVAATLATPFEGHVSRRPLLALFIDPRVVVLNPPRGLPTARWTVLASATTDPALAAAIAGARWTSVLAAAAAVMLVVGLSLSVRAIRASGRVAEMRAEFMTSVTHDLKTPIASIQALAQTVAAGRIPGTDQQREYGQLIQGEARRLTRLVDNVLAHARITDVADVYSFEPLDVDTVLHDAAGRLSHQLRQSGVALHIDTPTDLPRILADAEATALVVDNLLDNAIRYSGPSRSIRISAVRHREAVRFRFADEGVGIGAEDIGRVVLKGVRARNAPTGGSGLGLAIVKRIVDDHGGHLTIASVVDQGTVVTVDMPAVPEDATARPHSVPPQVDGAGA